MASFCIKVAPDTESTPTHPLKLVDLGGCEVHESVVVGGTQASWAHWTGTHQWKIIRNSQRVLLVEGQVDRYPDPDEELNHWLPRRWGSFRGFQIDCRQGSDTYGRVTAFVDRMATRPIFYIHVPGSGVYLADKLSTLALNLREHAKVNWPALLEAMVTAVLYTPDTTLDGVEEIRAAEVLEATPDRVEVRQQETLELEDYLDPDFVSRYPVESLRLALETSVSESWTDTNHRLLLSGGLDSRTVLMLAGPGRKTVTIGRTEIGEALIARSIAESCAADENGADKLDHRAAILSRVRAERN